MYGFLIFSFYGDSLPNLGKEKSSVRYSVVYIAAFGAMQIGTILFIHQNGGNRGIHYGATLRNQIRVVNKILKYGPESKIEIYVKNMNYFPHAYYTLLKILSGQNPRNDDTDLPTKDLAIDYVQNAGLPSGWIRLYETEQFPVEPLK